MANYPDSLIRRKCGLEIAQEASQRAADVMIAGRPREPAYDHALADFDRWLRADGHRRNPGTTADLIAAGLFVLLREGRLNWMPSGKKDEAAMSDNFQVRIAKAEHVFSAGHFITFGGICERLHGHNYHVSAEVGGPLDENHLVIDFLLVRAKLLEITTWLDHYHAAADRITRRFASRTTAAK